MKNSIKNLSTKKVRILFIANCFVVLISIIGCSSDDGLNSNSCENWSEQFLSQAEAYSNASVTYNNDPSVSNCNNLKDEGLNYVQALEGIISCVPTINRSEYNQDIKELKAEINSTNCIN